MEDFIEILFIPVFFLIPVSIFLIAFYFGIQRNKKDREKLAQIAKQLGLDFSVSNEHKLKDTGFHEIPKNSILSFIIDGLLSLSPNWIISGDIHNFSIRIYPVVRGSGKSRVTYTIIEMKFQNPLNIGLNISSEGFFEKIGIKLLGKQDIQIGDESIDKMVQIKGSDTNKVKDLLKSQSTKLSLKNLYGKYPDVIITDTNIIYEVTGVLTDLKVYSEVLKLMGDFSDSIQRNEFC